MYDPWWEGEGEEDEIDPPWYFPVGALILLSPVLVALGLGMWWTFRWLFNP